MLENNDLNKIKSFRTSKNREDVLAILKKSKIPMTVDDIHNKLRTKNTNISISTVYRIMEKLTFHNIATKSIIMDNNKAGYELISDKHKHYIICVKCNKMTPLENCPLGDLEESISNTTGFNITGHKLEIYGVCRDCAK